jgi:hypothetical protein
MKQFTKKAIALSFAFVITLTALFSTAQARSLHSIRVNIPFAFNVQDKQLAAGDYVVTEVAERTFLVQNIRTNEGTLITSGVTSEPTAKDKNSGLRFGIYDGRRYLTQIRLSSGGSWFTLYQGGK